MNIFIFLSRLFGFNKSKGTTPALNKHDPLDIPQGQQASADLLSGDTEEKDYQYEKGINHVFHEIPETIEDVFTISPAEIKCFVESLPDHNNIKKQYQSGALSDEEIAGMLTPRALRSDIDPAVFKSINDTALNIYGDKDDYKHHPDIAPEK